MPSFSAFSYALWHTLTALAPWLFLGMLIAGLLHGLVPAGWIRRQMRGVPGVFKAILVGVPLPLCSCGVIPAALGLRRDGASPGATAGFLISTPQTGVDSILVSAGLLGWPFALFKVAAAAVMGLVGGLLVHLQTPEVEISTSEPHTPAARPGAKAMAAHAMMILDSIWRWLTFGVLASAALEAFLPVGALGFATTSPFWSGLLALALSLPLYVCATASVPIASALVGAGMPVGAALVFLMAGPATNVATMGAVARALGRRALAIYLATIILGSLLASVIFSGFWVEASVTSHQGHGISWWEHATATALSLLLCGFLARDLSRAFAARRRIPQQRTFAVTGMTCGGCASTVERAARGVQGVTDAVVDRVAGTLRIAGSAPGSSVVAAVTATGYGCTLAEDHAG